MGEMTIPNLDDALLLALREKADGLGLAAETLAADLIKKGLQYPISDRARIARSIQAAQPTPSTLNSVDLIREDRSRG